MSNNKQFPYMCVHLRRKDFVKAYPDEVPSLKWAAYQIKLKLEESNVTQVFVATDAPMEGTHCFLYIYVSEIIFLILNRPMF